jgi:protein TonB
MSDLVLGKGELFPALPAAGRNERRFKLALGVSLVIHGILIAVVPGFRSVPPELPKTLTVEIVPEQKQPETVPLPVRRQPQRPVPEPPPQVTELPPVPPVVQQPPAPQPEPRRVEPRTEPRVVQPEPAPRQPEPVVKSPEPLPPPVPRTEVVQMAPRPEQRPEFTAPPPVARADVAPRTEPRVEVRPEPPPVVRAEPAPQAPVTAPRIEASAPAPRAAPAPVVPNAQAPAPVTAPAPPPPAARVDEGEAAAEKTLTAGYEHTLSDLIRRHQVYPERAQRNRWQGTTVVRVALDAEGRVESISILESSGREILDDAALNMVRKASPLPRAPEGLRGRARNVRVPIAFRLPAS